MLDWKGTRVGILTAFFAAAMFLIEGSSVFAGQAVSGSPAGEEKGDFFERLKRVPLTDDGKTHVSFGGHLRARFEAWNNFGFSEGNDDEFLLVRALFHADLHVHESLRFFVEGKAAHSTDRDLPGGRRAALDVDSIDLQQFFADIKFNVGDESVLIIRPGRRMLNFGKQRLVSSLPWANNLRAWDGISAILKTHGWTIEAFWTQFVPVRKYSPNKADAHTEFYGVYATGKVAAVNGTVDLYFLGLDRDDTQTFNGTMGDEERYTVGARVAGKIGETNFDYEVEAAFQFGEVGSADIEAYMVALVLGYTFEGVESKPRVWIGYDYASGDNSAGGDVETFNQLFPLGHAYFGFIDIVGRQNVSAFSVGVSAKPMKNMVIAVAGHVFHRADDADAFYNAGGGVVRAGGTGSDSELGQEIDVTLKYKCDAHTTILIGYSHFFAGDFVSESTPATDEDIDFFYFQWLFTF